MPKKAPSQEFLDTRSDNIESGWEDLAPTVTFCDVTLTQFQTQRAGVSTLRSQLKLAEQSVKNLRNQLGNAELELWDTCGLVVDGVIGNRLYGRNSALYASFGLVPTSQRASGLTRKTEPAKARARAKRRNTTPTLGIELPRVTMATDTNGANGHALSNGR